MEVRQKMDITYSDYINLGYSIIPEEEFARYSDMSAKTIKRFIKAFTKFTVLTEEITRGICEIADILYAEHNQLKRPLAGFSNENYREQYFGGKTLSHSEQIWETLRLYFTREELYRGV